MQNYKVSELPNASKSDEIQLLNTGGGYSKKLDGATLAAMMWDAMYIHAKKVIIPCPHCASHNAYTNPTCVRCGGPMGSV